jgi:6-phosphogluconolactonase
VLGAATLFALAIGAGACGKGIFSSADSSSSSGGGGGSSTTTRSVYVSNFGDGKVSSLDLNSSNGKLSHPATISGGTTNGPLGLASFSTTALYAANAADNTIYEYTLTNGKPSSLGTIAAGNAPQQIVLTPANAYAYAVNKNGGSISEYIVDSSTGALSNNTVSSIGGPPTTPLSIAASDANVYVTDLNGGAGVVWTFSINGDGTLASGPSSTPSLGNLALGAPNQIILDSTATYAFVGDSSGVVSAFQVSAATLAFLTTASTSQNVSVAGLAYGANIGGNDYIYCTNPQANSVSVFSWAPNSLTPTSTSQPGSSLNQPTGIAIVTSTATPYLYVTNAGNGTVTQFTVSTTDGSLTETNTFNTQSPANTAGQPMSIMITS